MKNTILIICLFVVSNGNAQGYLTRNGNISFYSHTPLEDIKAQNNEVASTLNTTTGTFEFRVAIKSFHFTKAAMEQHFGDEDYMDAEKYPKASFTGKITNLSSVNFARNGNYKITVQGSLTIKNITKPISAEGTITIKDSVIAAQSDFNINRKEFNVIGQSFVQQKIEDQIHISVNCEYQIGKY